MSTAPASPALIDPSLREAHAREIGDGNRFAFGMRWVDHRKRRRGIPVVHDGPESIGDVTLEA